MASHLFYAPNFPEEKRLTGEEAHHCLNVLRHTVGDEIEITDGKGMFFLCGISTASKKECDLDIKNSYKHSGMPYDFTLCIAPPKSRDRLEFLVEKVVETGITRLVFIKTEHSERTKVNLNRLKKISVAAMKQCKSAFLPSISEETFNDKMLKTYRQDVNCIAHVEAKKDHIITFKKNSSYTILIGPEGDFSKSEVDMAVNFGFKSLTLGPSVLRTETAGIYVSSLLNAIHVS